MTTKVVRGRTCVATANVRLHCRSPELRAYPPPANPVVGAGCAMRRLGEGRTSANPTLRGTAH